MNVRQQLYKKYRLEGYSKYSSAIKAGYSKNTALTASNLEKLINMRYWLELQGLTDSKLAEHAKEGLNANKVISANIIHGDADEKTNDFIEVPDWQSRHRYFETILKLQNKLKDLIIDNSKHEHKTFVQVYVPEPYSKEKVNAETMETSSRLTDRSV